MELQPHINLSLDDIPNEIWKPIKGYEGIYEVSNMGRIKSIFRIVKSKSSFTKIPLRILRQDCSSLYCRVTFNVENIKKRFSVHRIVLDTFIGHSVLQVDHINQIKHDNRLLNLEYVTQRENINRRFNNTNTSSNKRGVTFHKATNKWEAQIQCSNKKIHLGIYSTIEEASLAYNNYRKKIEQPDYFHTEQNFF